MPKKGTTKASDITLKKNLENPVSPIGKGRPPGAKNKTTLFKEAMRNGFENLLQKDGEKVFKAVVDKALDGDMTAAKLILDRIVPVVDLDKSSVKDRFNISINVSGMEPKIDVMDGTAVDAEFEEIE